MDPTLFTQEEWNAASADDPALPRNFEELSLLATALYQGLPDEIVAAADEADNAALADMLAQMRQFKGGGTVPAHLFRTGLRNPELTSEERTLLAAAAAPATFQHQILSSDRRFLLRWDSTGPFAIDRRLVEEASADCDTASDNYYDDFGRLPGASPTEVLFWDPKAPNTVYPNGPINLPVDFFKMHANNRLVRSLTVGHEVFHLIQAAFGFAPRSYTLWFYEGGATWAESVYYRAIASPQKLIYYFEHPTAPLDTLQYAAFPYWIFLENALNGVKSGAYAMVDLLQIGGQQRDPPPQRVIDIEAKKLGVDWSFNRLLTLMGMRMPLGNWFKTESGTEVIPAPRDAEQRTAPVIRYPTSITLASGKQHVFKTAGSFRFPVNRAGSFQLEIFKVTSSTGGNTFPILATVDRIILESANEWVGGAVFPKANNTPVSGFPTVPLSALNAPVTWNPTGDAQGIYVVIAGSATDSTSFQLEFKGG